MTRRSRFVDARALGRVRSLGLTAQRLVDGYLAGHHRSPRPGEGAELLQFRAYEPGDDLRRVDWRAYARSDRFFVRESEVERDIVVRFVLDATASMAVDSGEGSKLDAARGVIATLGMLADRQGDRVALQVVGGRPRRPVSAGGFRGGLRSLSAFFSELERVEAAGSWGVRGLARAGMPSRRRRDLVVVVSDLFQEESEIADDLARLAAVGHDVLLLHLLHRSEFEFSVPDEAVFRDAETGARLAVAAGAIRSEYLARRDAELTGWRRFGERLGIGYRLVLTDEPLSDWLPVLLRRRGVRGR